MTDVKLRPCPFCGSVNVDPHGWAGKYKGAHDGAIIHGPACDDCGASAGLLGNTTEENIALWNTRSESPVEKAAGEMQKRQVKQAFDMIASANTITILSLDEMESIVNRALSGEFDSDIPARAVKEGK